MSWIFSILNLTRLGLLVGVCRKTQFSTKLEMLWNKTSTTYLGILAMQFTVTHILNKNN